MSLTSIGGARYGPVLPAIPKIAEHLDPADTIIYSQDKPISEYELDSKAALIYARILAELPMENMAAMRAEQLAQLSITRIKSMLIQGRKVDDIVADIKRDVIKAREDNKIKMDTFMDMTWPTRALRRKIGKLEVVKVDGGLQMEQLSESQQVRLEVAIARLAEDQELQNGDLSYDEERGAWRFRVISEEGEIKYLYIRPESIRYTHVEEAKTEAGMEVYVITRRASPVMVDGKLVFREELSSVMVSKELMEKMGAKNKEEVVQMLREQDISQTRLMLAESWLETKRQACRLAEGVKDAAVSVYEGAASAVSVVGEVCHAGLETLGLVSPTPTQTIASMTTNQPAFT